MEAAADGHADCATLLLDHHADINATCQVRHPSRGSVLRAGELTHWLSWDVGACHY